MGLAIRMTSTMRRKPLMNVNAKITLRRKPLRNNVYACKRHWISLGIRHGNMAESRKLRGSETAIVHPERKVSTNVDISQVDYWTAQWGRAVCAERCKHGSEGGSRTGLQRLSGSYPTAGRAKVLPRARRHDPLVERRRATVIWVRTA